MRFQVAKKKKKKQTHLEKFKADFGDSLYTEINALNCDISVQILEALSKIIETSLEVITECQPYVTDIDVSDDEDEQLAKSKYVDLYAQHIKYIKDAASVFKSIQPEANRDIAELMAKQLMTIRETFQKAKHESAKN